MFLSAKNLKQNELKNVRKALIYNKLNTVEAINTALLVFLYIKIRINIYKAKKKIMETNKKDNAILALDAASKLCGYAVYKDGKVIDYGTWNLQEHQRGVKPTPFANLQAKLIEVISKYNISRVVMEDVFVPKNENRYMSYTASEVLFEVRGVVRLVCEICKIPYPDVYKSWNIKSFMYHIPREYTRQTLKTFMCKTVERLGYILPEKGADDTADALGVLFYALNEKLQA